MNILFICGCLEPGKDGVGDYTRTLGGALVLKGASVSFLSINDGFVNSDYNKNTENELRISSSLLWDERVALAKKFVSEINPDFISLQFVPYSFNRKGVLKSEIYYFKEIMKGYKVHIMFHELWVGAHTTANFKARVYNLLQRTSIKKLITTIKPRLINTSCAVFQFMLKKINVNSSRLPIFSNIRLNKEQETWVFYEFLKKYSINTSGNFKSACWVFSLFGGIHNEFDYSSLFSLIKSNAKKHNKKVIIISIGKIGNGLELWNKMKMDFEDSFTFISTGPQDSSLISTFLSNTDFGITAYPDIAVGKSGSIAAFLEHKVPVIVSRRDIVLKGFTISKEDMDGLILYPGEFDNYINSSSRKPLVSSYMNVEEVADKFLQEIKNM